MKLTDLSPRWIERDGEKVLFIFKSPTDPTGKRWLSCKRVTMDVLDQHELILAACPDMNERDVAGVAPSREGFAWTINGDDFATMTVTPSIDASPSGDWHGFITNGEIVGGI